MDNFYSRRLDIDDNVLVSVIITTYNRPHYLKQTLFSVTKQDYKNIEVVVIDDGTPGNENKELCECFDNVRYYKIRNTGSPVVPRNEGFRLSVGIYVAFLDDDDLWLPNKLRQQVDILNRYLEYGLVHGYCRVIDQFGDETGKIVGRLKNPERKHGYVFDDMVGNFTVMMPTPLIRREWVEKVGGFNNEISAAGEDMEFFCHLSFYTKFYYIDEALALYRVHSGGISQNNYQYNWLPLILFQLVSLLRNRGLSLNRYNVIRQRLIIRQLELIDDYKTLKVALINCFKMDAFFFLKFHLISVCIKQVFTTLISVSNHINQNKLITESVEK